MAKKQKTHINKIEKRDPVVAIMGHIDHGKSTLLDYIRKANVVDGEAGGITQHVSAYEATYNDRKITFLDTPGHEAFAATRSRGASIADVAILVVAADDGVKEQTKGAFDFIVESKIPFVVAINKIDKNGANVQNTLNSLTENGIYVEGMGGDVSYTPVSAVSGEGIDDLLETVLLATDVEELEGDRNTLATGYILESSLDPKKGISATLVIKNGSMKTGQYVTSGSAGAPVRIMEDFTGTQIRDASFSKPIKIIGFDELPEAGSDFTVFENKKDAQAFNKEIESLGGLKEKEITDTDIKNKLAIPLVIKADVQGSVDAIKHQLEKIKSPTAYFKILSEGVGEISEADVKTAGAGGEAVFVGFNVGISRSAKDTIELFDMTANTYTIIYELTDFLEGLLEERRPRVKTEKISGTARIIRVFSWSNKGGVIGGKVKDGFIEKSDKLRIIRRDHQIGTATIKELQRGKQSAERIELDDEFGMMVESRFEIVEGDQIQGFVITEE